MLFVLLLALLSLSHAATLCFDVGEIQAMVITCPENQYIASVDFASFGTPSGSCGTYAVNNSCHALNSNLVASQCIGVDSCKFLVSIAPPLYDPCPNVAKRFVAQVSCVPYSATPYDMKNEGERISLACPANTYIAKVDFASFGTPNGTNGTFVVDSRCHAANSLQFVSQQCFGLHNCSFLATGANLQVDPCENIHKRFFVKVSCSPYAPVCSSVGENLAVLLHCPGNMNIAGVNFASFGTPSGTCGAFQKSSYHAENSTVFVEQKCLGTPDCTFLASTAPPLGDPYPNTYKKFSVQASCSPKVANSGTVCAEAQESSWVRLTCPENTIITAINFASFGTPYGYCGAYGVDEKCHAANSSLKAVQDCTGLNSCSFLATGGRPLGDPCPNTRKRFYAQATCSRRVNMYDVCTSSYTAKQADTCVSISLQNNLPVSQLQSLNPKLNCSSTDLSGSSICLFYNAQLNLGACTASHSVVSGDICYNLWNNAGLTESQFRLLNPGVDCNALQVGQSLCVETANTKSSCTSVYTVKAGDTCYDIRLFYGIDPEFFNVLNPNVNCANLQIGAPLCVLTGPFNIGQCSKVYRVMANDTCSAIASKHSLSIASFNALNPHIDCQKLNTSAMASVCVAGLGGIGAATTLQYLVTKLSPINSAISTAYNTYLSGPTDDTEAAVMDLIFLTCATPEGLAKLLSLASDPTYNSIQNGMSAGRPAECIEFTTSNFNRTATCMCDNSRPYLYCKGIFHQEINQMLESAGNMRRNKQFMQDLVQALSPEIDSFVRSVQAHQEPVNAVRNSAGTNLTHSKRTEVEAGPCSFTFGMTNDWSSTCMGGGCCAPIIEGLIDGCAYLTSCVPTVGILDSQASKVKLCKSEGDCQVESLGTQAFNSIVETYVLLKLGLCIHLPESVKQVFEMFGIEACFAFIEIKYFPIKQRTEIGFGVTVLGFVTLEISVEGQTGKAPGKWCHREELHCEDFCLDEKGDSSWKFDITATFFGRFTKKWHIYDSKEEKECPPLLPETPPPPYQIIGYYGNWPYYKTSEVYPLPADVTKKMTRINYAFAMISYDITYDRWYTDFSDAWADVGVCGEVDDEECMSKQPPGIPMATSCYLSVLNTQQPAVAVTPFIGAKYDSCPLPSQCFNKGGPPPGRTKIPCNTHLNGLSRPFWYNDKHANMAYALGQYNYILNQARTTDTSVALSIGGWYDSNYFTSASSPQYIDDFVSSLIKFVHAFGFDHVDIDWEYPGFEHGNQSEPFDNSAPFGDADSTFDCAIDASKCKRNRANDGAQYINLLKKIRDNLQITNNGEIPELTITAPAGAAAIAKFDIPAICAVVDSVNIMTYDIHGSWDSITGHQSPIYDNSPGLGGGFNSTAGISVHSAVMAWIEGGCEPSQINIGVPFYGRVFNFNPSTPSPAPATVSGTATTSTGSTCTATHTVQPSEYCYLIASNAGITVAQLQALNPAGVCDNLQVGTVLCIAASASPASSSSSSSSSSAASVSSSSTTGSQTCSTHYTVVSGDSCWAIANSHGLTTAQLEAMNPGLQCTNLQLGQVLCVASASSSSTTGSQTCSTHYTVVSGDSCWSIANARGMTVTQLEALNPGVVCASLQLGQVLCVSSSKKRSVMEKRDPSLPGLYQPFAHTGGQAQMGTVTMNDVMTYDQIMAMPGLTHYWDDVSKASYAYNTDMFISYDSVQAVKAKMDYVKQWKLRGVICWMLGQDSNVLLDTVYNELNA